MITLLWAVVIGLPVAVLVAALVWPESVPPDRKVRAIRERIEAEGDDPGHGSDRR